MDLSGGKFTCSLRRENAADDDVWLHNLCLRWIHNVPKRAGKT